MDARAAESPKQAGKGPIKVFILAGQSNMQGQGLVEGKDDAGNEKKGTLTALLGEQEKAPLLQHLRDKKGNWIERDDVWVYDINEFATTKGRLALGFGWNPNDKNWFGPELQFGHIVGNRYENQVLIIKTAWGGKSLAVDFRPPSSGGTVGPYYKLMIDTVRHVLSEMKKEFPNCKANKYEIAGFVWWHGWNDFCDPEHAVPEYQQNLVNLINDVRHDLNVPTLPVVIGEFTGPWGADCSEAPALAIRKAQAETASRSEFKGSVRFVETHDFVRAEKDSPTSEGYHEFKNAETYFLVGNALGMGMLDLLEPKPAVAQKARDQELPPPPDLTKGEKKTDTPDWNLGPTGATGWIFGRDFDTSDARQILVSTVAKGSPAEGVLEPGDVLVGLDGKEFDRDARVALGRAITEAEKTASGGKLHLLTYRKGKTKAVTVQLEVLGSYSDTSPYDCKKAAAIIDRGCRAIAKRGFPGGSFSDPVNGGDWEPEIPNSINALALLASGKQEYRGIVKDYAHKIGPANLQLVLQEGLYTWTWSYANLFLTEYYLATKDEYVLPAIKEFSHKIAIGQSAVGTWGHGFKIEGNNGTLGGYGAINQTGLICWMSLALAQKCEIHDPDVDRAVDISHTFFRFYVGKGSVPYGDHPPYWLHDDNGKSSSAAVTFDLLGDATATRFFSRMATAAYGEKELGHTGNYFGYLWGALGANRAGPAAVAAYLKELRWYYDLARKWDGSFFTISRDNYDYDMTGLFVLHECMPLKKLYITGKGVDEKNSLQGPDLEATLESGREFALGRVDTAFRRRSTSELLRASADWSPTLRERAAREIGTRKDDLVPDLVKMLENPDLNARYGACLALQHLGARAAPATEALIRQLDHADMWLRVRAAFALTAIGHDAIAAVPLLLKRMTIRDQADPRGLEAKYLSFALFRSDYIDQIPNTPGLIANSLAGVDRTLAYPAIRRMLASDDGLGTFAMRSIFKSLEQADVDSLLPDILKAASTTPPSGEMFAQEIRFDALAFMAKHKIKEGLPIFIDYAKTQNGWGSKTKEVLPLLTQYGAAARLVLPDLKALRDEWKKKESAEKHDGPTRGSVADEVIAAIEAAK